jgi:putative spermidine/putrescine transport system substrate-binding protein
MPARIACAAVCPNRFLDAVILFIGCCMLIAHASAAENVLRVLAWPGYADPDVVKGFESRYHAKVEVTLIDSDEALWDKMHQGKAPQFDVLAANTAEIQRYAHDNLLAPAVAAFSRIVVDRRTDEARRRLRDSVHLFDDGPHLRP